MDKLMRRNSGAPFALSALALAVSMGVAGAASADTLSVQGSWLDFKPGDDARTYAIECTDCSDTSNIKAFPNKDYESKFEDTFSASFKWTHELSGRGLWGSDDIAIGGGFFTEETETTTMIANYQAGGNIGTPYGTIDSSSTGANGKNQDEVWFATGDIELGWNRQHGNSDVRYHVGLRTQFMEYERNAIQDLSSSNVYNGEETSEFFGIGPRVGVSIKKPLGTSKNIALIGSVSGGVMYGKLKRDFSVTADTDAVDDLRDRSSREWVPFMDAEAGFAYNIEEGISLELGYTASYQDDIILLGSVCTDDYYDDVKPYNPSCGDDESSAITHGPFLRMTAEF
ncbi:MAG: Lpg1974 family pore-forming outer membrane protein [Cycloclasticus sp.]